MYYFAVTVLMLDIVKCVSAQTRAEFMAVLLHDYDNRIPPNFERNNSTEVEVSLFINSIDSINEKTMDYTLDAYVQQEWDDFRLIFYDMISSKYLELDSKLIQRVWVPDLYFANEKKAQFHDVTVPNRMLHLRHDGRIVYRLRVSITASCPMNLQKYPFDSQVCSLYIQSFAFTTSRLTFKWKEDRPIKTNRQLELPQFVLNGHKVKTCLGFGEDSGNFTCIQLDLFFKRNLGFYMIQMYIPTILIVLLSWVSFWLSVDAVPARISLGILTVLTMTTQKTNSVASVPPVSYIKALDIWMAACLLFVFAALLEFAFAYVNKRNENKRMVSKVSVGEVKVPLNPDHQDDKKNETVDDPAKRIDNIAKILFPVVFLVFLVLYWIVYTI